MSSRKDLSPLETNLAALEKLLPGAAIELLRSAQPAPELELADTPSGNPTCRAHGIWVHSRYDPKKEAARLVEREVPRSTEVCIFESFALGYHVEAFLELLPAARAIVLEPDIRWLRSAIGARALAHLFATDRLTLLVNAEVELLPVLLEDAVQVHVVRLRALADKDRDYFERVSQELQAIAARRDVNKNTLARFGKRWVRNLIRNVDLLATSQGVNDLEGLLRGLPCIVLAAGPSLDRILPHLEELRKRFVLLAVDTSYRAALARGIVPDFLTVVDPQYWNARHLDGCAAEETILVSESATYPAVFHRPLGSLFFCGSLFPLGRFLEARAGERGALGAGGSVSTTTWDLARLLGCAPIHCAGLDLGFPERKTHFRGAFFEERLHGLSGRTDTAETTAFHLLHDAAPYPVPNNSGGVTLTDRRLVIYKWWFENQLKIHTDCATYNLSPNGIRIAGMKPSDVAELLDRPTIREEIDRRLSTIRTAEVQPRQLRSTLHEAVSDLVGRLETLRETADQGMRAVDDLEKALRSGFGVASALARLESLDRAIGEQDSREIAGFLVHATAQTILEKDPGGQDNEEERTRQIITDSRLLYRGLRDAAGYHIDLLREAAGRLASTSDLGSGETPGP